MYIKYAILADSIAPGGAGKTNIIGTFDRMFSKEFPFVYASFSLLIKFDIDHDEENKRHKLKLEFVDQDGHSKRKPFEKNMVFPSSSKGSISNDHQLIINITNFQINEPGQHEFAIYINGRYLYGVPLVVEQSSS